MRVLLAEDDMFQAMVATALLQDAKFEVTSFATGAEVLQALSAEAFADCPFDAVRLRPSRHRGIWSDSERARAQLLLDFELEDMDAIQVLEGLRGTSHLDSMRKIILSGHDRPELRTQLWDLGVSGESYWVKPLTADLCARVRGVSLLSGSCSASREIPLRDCGSALTLAARRRARRSQNCVRICVRARGGASASAIASAAPRGLAAAAAGNLALSETLHAGLALTAGSPRPFAKARPT
jgi:CheY-like chemotaxis protein